MNIIRLSWINLVSNKLSTLLSVLLMTFGVGIISLILIINNEVEQQLERNLRGVDMVVGAKGSPLQLILSTVYHVDNPTGNIPLKEVNKLKRNPLVKSTIPLSFGDSYKGYRIVGTTHDYIDLYEARLEKGKIWTSTLEVVLGNQVAQANNLEIGSSFHGSHGLVDGGHTHDEHDYRVVGILEPSNSVIDRLILTSTESVWMVHDHGHSENENTYSEVDDEDHNIDNHEHIHEKEEHHDEENHMHEDEVHHTENGHETKVHHHDEEGHNHQNDKKTHAHIQNTSNEEQHHTSDKEMITALLVKFRNPIGIVQLPRMINETTSMQAAVPALEISRLVDLLGFGFRTINLIALIIIIVSGLSIFIGLYNALIKRKKDLALIRVHGATRWQLVQLVLLEGIIVTLLGGILGLVFSRIALLGVSQFIGTGYDIHLLQLSFLSSELWLLCATLSVGLLASIIPTIQSYQINLPKTLTDE